MAALEELSSLHLPSKPPRFLILLSCKPFSEPHFRTSQSFNSHSSHFELPLGPIPSTLGPGTAQLGLPQDPNGDFSMPGGGLVCCVFWVSIFYGAKPHIHSALKHLQHEPRGSLSADLPRLTPSSAVMLERTLKPSPYCKNGLGCLPWTLEIIHSRGVIAPWRTFWRCVGCFLWSQGFGGMLLAGIYSVWAQC